jgi:hypothetical protein
MYKMQIKRLILLVLFVLSGVTFPATAKDKPTNKPDLVNLSGTIIDRSSGELLAGVTVVLNGTDLKTITDFDGYFTFDNLTPGKYTLSSEYISYKECVTLVDIMPEKKNKINILLTAL